MNQYRYYQTSLENKRSLHYIHHEGCPLLRKCKGASFLGTFYSMKHAKQYATTHHLSGHACVDCMMIEIGSGAK